MKYMAGETGLEKGKNLFSFDLGQETNFGRLGNPEQETDIGWPNQPAKTEKDSSSVAGGYIYGNTRWPGSGKNSSCNCESIVGERKYPQFLRDLGG